MAPFPLSLSLRDVEEAFAACGIEVSREIVRRWTSSSSDGETQVQHSSYSSECYKTAR